MPAAGLQITPRDREMLGFAAEHRIVLAEHIAALVGITARAADARLRSLEQARLLRREIVIPGRRASYRISRLGLGAIGSELPPPRLDPRCYEHDVGLGWLWLASRDGVFGAGLTVIGERRLRSHDAGRERGEQPLAVRLGGFGPGGQERLHYPDLLLVSREGKRLALELELTAKGRLRRERILEGYGADARIEAVLYLVRDRRLGRAIAASAGRLGLSSRVYVKLVSLSAPGVPGVAAETSRGPAGRVGVTAVAGAAAER